MSSTSINTDISRRLDIVARRGDTFILHLEVLNADLIPYNLSNYKVKLSIVKERRQEPLITMYGNDNHEGLNFITNGDGFISINVPSEVTSTWREGDYVYDLSITSLFGEENKVTWLVGQFILNPDITI
tara:strand:+ start:96 stop:482 length:387 start_codon:yes stop_codon:yes gene_type:complete